MRSIAHKLTEMGYGDEVPKLQSWRPHYLNEYTEGTEDMTNEGEFLISPAEHIVLSSSVAQLGRP